VFGVGIIRVSCGFVGIEAVCGRFLVRICGEFCIFCVGLWEFAFFGVFLGYLGCFYYICRILGVFSNFAVFGVGIIRFLVGFVVL